METLTNREGYAPVTLNIMEHIGEDRLNVLQVAIATDTDTIGGTRSKCSPSQLTITNKLLRRRA